MARRYERWGLLPPAERSAAGHRRYGPAHLHAILALRAMQAGYGWRPGNAIMRHVLRGEVAEAVALVDARHADLHQRRLQVDATLAVLRVAAAAPAPGDGPRRPGHPRDDAPLRVGAAARAAGVPVSSLHFWESQSLLAPLRDRASNYRLYDRAQLARLRVVKVLRDAGYGFAAIRLTLDELGTGRPEAALSAIERRRRELTRASERCARATAAFWGYVAEAYDEPGPLSGSLGRAPDDA
jgi:DNA-binding transcriptional MerR regulator